MKRTYYFTVEKELYDDGESLNGNKNISVYLIADDKPYLVNEIECGNEENSVEKIKEFLEDLEIDCSEFTFVQL